MSRTQKGIKMSEVTRNTIPAIVDDGFDNIQDDRLIRKVEVSEGIDRREIFGAQLFFQFNLFVGPALQLFQRLSP
jgi:hypothetical protein